ncbi:YmfQ family protein [Thalassospira marina]|uniref:Uncharacterized protein n=1 Tax=Thalassospira marina TaxID=2048283 RepID=A0A2N3KJS6_9PROT|nr:putative phage tail protein [Thalassospira marina]PKR50756.1 hypothetical protein COO20_20170 [Thalassospira marina]
MTDYDDRLEAYAETAASALPPGAFWQGFRDYDGTGRDLLRAKAQTWLDVDLAAERLIAESQPARASEMLVDHETQVGLPDCCFQTLNVNIEDRRTAVLTRYRAQGGQSPEYFIDLAKSLGYDVSITESRPFVCGLSEIGGDSSGAAPVARFDTIGADRFSWKVVVPEPRVTWFRCGSGVLGQDALATINRADDLECLLTRYQPAQQDLTVSYRGIPEPIIDIDLRNGLPAGWQFSRAGTATYIDAAGLPALASIDEIRIKHDPSSLRTVGATIEGPQTNSVRRTNGFSFPWYSAGGTPLVVDHSTLGSVVIQHVSGGNLDVDNTQGASGDLITVSGYVHRDSPSFSMFFNSFAKSAGFSFSTGSPGFNFRILEDYGDVRRVAVTFMRGDGSMRLRANDGCIGGGFQTEVGAFATSLIPTGGGPVTRSLDNLKIPLSSVVGWQAGASFESTVSGWTAEGIGSTGQCLFAIDDGSNNNSIVLQRWYTDNKFYLTIGNGGIFTNVSVSAPIIGKHHLEVTVHIETNNFWFSMSVDDGTPVTYGPNASTTIPAGLTTIFLGGRSDGLRAWFGEIEKFKLRFLSTPA